MALIAMLLRTLTGEEPPDDAGPLRPSEVGTLRTCFDSIDIDRSGEISLGEFVPWCLSAGLVARDAPYRERVAAALVFRDIALGASASAGAAHDARQPQITFDAFVAWAHREPRVRAAARAKARRAAQAAGLAHALAQLLAQVFANPALFTAPGGFGGQQTLSPAQLLLARARPKADDYGGAARNAARTLWQAVLRDPARFCGNTLGPTVCVAGAFIATFQTYSVVKSFLHRDARLRWPASDGNGTAENVRGGALHSGVTRGATPAALASLADAAAARPWTWNAFHPPPKDTTWRRHAAAGAAAGAVHGTLSAPLLRLNHVALAGGLGFAQAMRALLRGGDGGDCGSIVRQMARAATRDLGVGVAREAPALALYFASFHEALIITLK